MKSLKSYLGKASGAYGILHAIGCPYHGLLALALKTGLVLHPNVTKVVEMPHELVTHHVFEPAWNRILKDDSSEKSHSHHSCSTCSDHYHFKGSFEDLLESENPNYDSENISKQDQKESRHQRVHRYAHNTSDITGWAAFLGFMGFSARKYYLKRKDKKDCSCGNH